MEFRHLQTVVIELLRTPELRRLRRVRQMGLGHMVFPGAEHSRLVHSLGAAHLAIRFAHQLADDAEGVLAPLLRPDQEAIRDIAVAALCHDIGHGPLSHAWEREVVGDTFPARAGEWFTTLGVDPDRFTDPTRYQWHEVVGQAMLTGGGDLHQLLETYSRGFSERIAALLRGTYHLPYLPALISGDVDVDRADYLLRDSLACGVRYGRYDVGWLLTSFRVGFVGDGASRRVVAGFDRRKAPKVIEQFLIARAAMYDMVYQHKTVRSIEGMVGQFFRRMRKVDPALLAEFAPDSEIFGPYLRAFSGDPVPLSDILKLDDYGLWNFLEFAATANDLDTTARDLAQRITRRDLFQMVPAEPEAIIEFMLGSEPHSRLNEVVQKNCEGDPTYYWFVDEAKTKFLADDAATQGYLIDDDRRALRFRDCPEFPRLPRDPQSTTRLFTIRSAVPDVLELLQ